MVKAAVEECNINHTNITMEIIYLTIGLCVGIIAGYLAAARKAGVLQTKLEMQQSHAQDLLTAEQQRNTAQQELIKQELHKAQQKQEETQKCRISPLCQRHLLKSDYKAQDSKAGKH